MMQKKNGGAVLTAPPGRFRSLWDRFRRYLRRYWFLYMLVAPGLIFMLVFHYGPMYGIQLAFKDYKPALGVWRSPWAGLDHFKAMCVDPDFWRALKNTLIYNCEYLVIGSVFTIFLALMLNELRLKRTKSVVQTAVYLPRETAELHGAVGHRRAGGLPQLQLRRAEAGVLLPDGLLEAQAQPAVPVVEGGGPGGKAGAAGRGVDGAAREVPCGRAGWLLIHRISSECQKLRKG